MRPTIYKKFGNREEHPLIEFDKETYSPIIKLKSISFNIHGADYVRKVYVIFRKIGKVLIVKAIGWRVFCPFDGEEFMYYHNLFSKMYGTNKTLIYTNEEEELWEESEINMEDLGEYKYIFECYNTPMDERNNHLYG